jgi:hypothetical protein
MVPVTSQHDASPPVIEGPREPPVWSETAPTQPQLTTGLPGAALPASGVPWMPAPPGPPIGPPGYPAAAVPPVPPAKGRGAGFWVGVTAAIAAAAVLVLLGGFFLGRSSRLSDAQVQTQINQQSLTDKIATQKALTDQAATLRTERIRLVRRAADRSRSRALTEGRTEGRQQGFDNGQASGFEQGQSSGYANGQNDGYQSGISDGSCLSNFLTC